MAINLPQAYSKILDRGFTVKSLTAPAFKGKYEVVGGTTKTFKIFSTESQPLYDYSTNALPAAGGEGVGDFGFIYKPVSNLEQTITAANGKAFSGVIDKADAKFSRDGSLDASEFMRVQMEEVIYPTIDKYNIASLVTAAGAPQTTTLATTTSNAFATFQALTTAQTNAFVPASGRVAFVSATFFAKVSVDPTFTPASEMTAKSRRSGNYGMLNGVEIIEVPDSYMPTNTDVVLTHESIAAAPKYLADYNQGEAKESFSGYFVNGRVVYDAFVYNKKKAGIRVLKSA